jgi:hypothetical protein
MKGSEGLRLTHQDCTARWSSHVPNPLWLQMHRARHSPADRKDPRRVRAGKDTPVETRRVAERSCSRLRQGDQLPSLLPRAGVGGSECTAVWCRPAKEFFAATSYPVFRSWKNCASKLRAARLWKGALDSFEATLVPHTATARSGFTVCHSFVVVRS